MTFDTERFVTNDGVSLFFRKWIGTTGQTLLILHGLGSDGRQFIDDSDWYQRQGLNVVLPDLRGHGESSSPSPLSPDNLTVEKMAEDVLALLDAQGAQNVHIVGNSMGGVVALAMLEIAPEKVLSLTTFGTVFKLNFPPFVPYMQMIVGKFMGAKRLSEVTANSVTQFEPTRAFIREVYARLDIDLVFAIQQRLRKYDFIAQASEYEGKIQILRGDADKEINKYLDETLNALRGTKGFSLVEVEDAGHFTNLDQPKMVREAVLEFVLAAER